MPKLCNVNLGRCQNLFEELDRFAAELRRKFPVKDIYLFGSLAKNEIHEGSDIDLIIIGDFRGKMFERIAKVLELTELPIEPLVYTEEEFCRMREQGNPFIKEVLETAKKLI